MTVLRLVRQSARLIPAILSVNMSSQFLTERQWGSDLRRAQVEVLDEGCERKIQECCFKTNVGEDDRRVWVDRLDMNSVPRNI